MTDDTSHLFGHSCFHEKRGKYIANLYCPQCKKFKCPFCEHDHLLVSAATMLKWIATKYKLQAQEELKEKKKKCVENIDKYYSELKDAATREYERAKASLASMGSELLSQGVEEDMKKRGVSKESIPDLVGQGANLPINAPKVDVVKQYLDKIKMASQKFDEILENK